jgi:hypothetical protein
MTTKRPIRRRLWGAADGGDGKADARNVGENVRDLSSALLSLPPQRIVTFDNQVYTSDGLVFPQASAPLGVVMIWSETADGQIKTTALTGLKVGSGTATATFGLVPGERYATIRLLVIG